MATLHHEIRIDAPVAQVWSVLADIEAVQHYNPTVASARCTSPAREGIGASRHCDLKPKGWVKERVTVWEAERALGLEVSESEWPIVYMRWRTDVTADGKGTLVAQDLEYEMKFGLLGRLMDALMMRRKLRQGVGEVFAGLKRYVEGGARNA
jgi:ligand-binding SRPBCC domain-containing protein